MLIMFITLGKTVNSLFKLTTIIPKKAVFQDFTELLTALTLVIN